MQRCTVDKSIFNSKATENKCKKLSTVCFVEAERCVISAVTVTVVALIDCQPCETLKATKRKERWAQMHILPTLTLRVSCFFNEGMPKFKKRKERKSKKGHALKDPQGILVQQIHAKPLMIASVFL